MEALKQIRVSENIAWTLQKGSWMIHIVLTLALFSICTFFSNKNIGLQLTILSYNLITFYYFHWIIGDPFDSRYGVCTLWEQMTDQVGSSQGAFFMAIYPCALFFLGNRLVEWNNYLFFLSVLSFSIVMVPKFRFMHMKRIFGLHGL